MSPLINGIDYNIAFHQKDDALPYLVLLHGFMGSGRVFTPLVNRLKPLCNPVTVDLLGHGQTEGAALSGRFDVERQIADLNQFLSTFTHPLFLHGYSMGGRLGLRYTLRHPETLTGLILESATYGLKDEEEIIARKKADEDRARTIEQDFETFVENWQKIPLFQNGITPPPSNKTAYLNIQKDQRPAQMARSLRGFGTAQMPSVKHRLGELKVPTLLIAGQADRKYTEIAGTMHQRLPNSTLSIIPNAGHRVHLENPQAFAEKVQSFINQYSPL